MAALCHRLVSPTGMPVPPLSYKRGNTFPPTVPNSPLTINSRRTHVPQV